MLFHFLNAVSNFKVTNAFGVLYNNIRILCLTLHNEEFHVFFFSLLLFRGFIILVLTFVFMICFELYIMCDMSKEREVFVCLFVFYFVQLSQN